MGDFCNKVVTIPQYNETCWFNTILMSLLYSQNSRKLLLYKMTEMANKNKLTRIINRILKSHYVNPEKAQEYFKIFRPEVILSYVQDIDRYTLKNMIYNGWFSQYFIHNFIEQLGCSCLTIDYYMDAKRAPKLYAGISQRINIYSTQDTFANVEYLEDQFDIYDTILSTPHPDYICINTWMVATRNIQGINKKIFTDAKHYKRDLQFDKYGFEYSGIIELKDEIVLNGNIYKLDSCILSNYNNNTQIGHNIAGITCKSKRHIYNGWMRTTQDRAKEDVYKIDDEIDNALPCELMEFKWDIHDKTEFCINSDLCKLPYLTSQRQKKKSLLCFSFAKGDKTLIYVKQQNDIYKSVDMNSINTPTSLSSQRSLQSLESYGPVRTDDSNISISPINSAELKEFGAMSLDIEKEQKKLLKAKRQLKLDNYRKELKEIREFEKIARKEKKRHEIAEKKELKFKYIL
jgi:hypothetical protein